MTSNRLVSTAYSRQTASKYDQHRFTTVQGQLFHQLEAEQLMKALDLCSLESEVLEVGCGTGRFLEIVAQTGRMVTGVDPSPYMLDIAKDRCSQFPNTLFMEGEGRSLPFDDNKFDFAYTIRVLNQTESEAYALWSIAELLRVTKPGGMVLIEYCNKWRPRSTRETAIRLSTPQVVSAVKRAVPKAKLSHSGILFLSSTLLHRTPASLVNVFSVLDRMLCKIAPLGAARCYLLVKLVN